MIPCHIMVVPIEHLCIILDLGWRSLAGRTCYSMSIIKINLVSCDNIFFVYLYIGIHRIFYLIVFISRPFEEQDLESFALQRLAL